MAFTDEDLKRLRDVMDPECTYDGCDTVFALIPGLLARLEAAEDVCLLAEECSECMSGTPKVIEAWRIEAGKSAPHEPGKSVQRGRR